MERKPIYAEDFDFEAMFKQYDVNAVGVVRMAKAFMNLILKSDLKCMVNISSEVGSIGSCWINAEFGYCISKAAQNMATKIMQNTYKEVKFYSIHPGWMITPQGLAGALSEASPNQKTEETAQKLYDMAQTQNVEHLYCDFNGNKLGF